MTLREVVSTLASRATWADRPAVIATFFPQGDLYDYAAWATLHTLAKDWYTSVFSVGLAGA
jgi:hypothetical protein